MSDLRAFASTSNLVRFTIKGKTTGQGLTGLTTATSGLIISTIADNEATPTVYTAAGSTIETITTLGTFATPTATKCRFKLVDNTNHPGLYEFQFADARFAVASSKRLVISVNDAESTILDADYEIELVQFNPFDAVRLGLTSLPNAAFGATGGLWAGVIRSGTLQAATSTTATLDASASAVTDFYRDAVLVITGGTGAGQARVINSYNGVTKIATLFRVFYTTPDNTSTFSILPLDDPSVTASGGQVSVGNPSTTIRASTCQLGGTANTAKLDAAASATNNLYVGNLLQITGGSGAGQSRTIVAYNGTTKIATVDRNWITIPDNTSPFSILASLVPTTFSDQGVAQAGGATTITLASTASTTDSLYAGSVVSILSGTGSGQTREITAYVGATRVATVNSAWSVNPDATSAYAVIPTSSGTGAETGGVTVDGFSAAGLAALFTIDSTKLYTDAVAGSPVKEIIAGVGSAGGAPTTDQIKAAIFTDLLAHSDFSTADSFGKLVKDNLNATVSSRMATFTLPTNFSALAITPGGIASADIQTIKTQTVTCAGSVTDNVNVGTTQPVNFVGTAGSALVKSDAINIGGLVPGSAVIGTVTTVTNQLTAAAIATTFFTDLMASSDFSTSGSFGKLIKDDLNATVSSRVATSGLPNNFDLLSIDSSGHVRVQTGVRKNTALANFQFVMVDASQAPTAGLTVTATRNIDNAGFAACANAVAEVANGWYVINLAAADLNGDVIALRLVAAGALDRDVTIVTSP